MGVKQAPLQPQLLIRLLVVPSGAIMLPVVEKLAINAIVFGAMLFVRGLIPGVLGAALMEGLRNCRDYPSPSRGPIHNIQIDMRVYGNIRLLVGGGVMMILGLAALPSK